MFVWLFEFKSGAHPVLKKWSAQNGIFYAFKAGNIINSELKRQKLSCKNNNFSAKDKKNSKMEKNMKQTYR